jgi:carboxyl-terminal processing protease
VAVPEFQHEADLRGALPNPDAPAKKPAKENGAAKDAVGPGASAPEAKPAPAAGAPEIKPATGSTAAGTSAARADPASAPAAKPASASPADPNGTTATTAGDPAQDYQLSRALDLLRGAAMFRKLAQR